MNMPVEGPVMSTIVNKAKPGQRTYFFERLPEQIHREKTWTLVLRLVDLRKWTWNYNMEGG